MTRWPGFGVGGVPVTFMQRLNGNTHLAQIVVQFTQSNGLAGNAPEILDSTEQAPRFTSLSAAGPSDRSQIPVLSTAEVMGGALRVRKLTEARLYALWLSDLSASVCVLVTR